MHISWERRQELAALLLEKSEGQTFIFDSQFIVLFGVRVKTLAFRRRF